MQDRRSRTREEQKETKKTGATLVSSDDASSRKPSLILIIPSPFASFANSWQGVRS